MAFLQGELGGVVVAAGLGLVQLDLRHVTREVNGTVGAEEASHLENRLPNQVEMLEGGGDAHRVRSHFLVALRGALRRARVPQQNASEEERAAASLRVAGTGAREGHVATGRHALVGRQEKVQCACRGVPRGTVQALLVRQFSPRGVQVAALFALVQLRQARLGLQLVDGRRRAGVTRGLVLGTSLRSLCIRNSRSKPFEVASKNGDLLVGGAGQYLDALLRLVLLRDAAAVDLHVIRDPLDVRDRRLMAVLDRRNGAVADDWSRHAVAVVKARLTQTEY